MKRQIPEEFILQNIGNEIRETPAEIVTERSAFRNLIVRINRRLLTEMLKSKETKKPERRERSPVVNFILKE